MNNDRVKQEITERLYEERMNATERGLRGVSSNYEQGVAEGLREALDILKEYEDEGD